MAYIKQLCNSNKKDIFISEFMFVWPIEWNFLTKNAFDQEEKHFARRIFPNIIYFRK